MITLHKMIRNSSALKPDSSRLDNIKLVSYCYDRLEVSCNRNWGLVRDLNLGPLKNTYYIIIESIVCCMFMYL